MQLRRLPGGFGDGIRWLLTYSGDHRHRAGILFWDVTTILLNPTAFKYVIELFAAEYKDKKVDVIAGGAAR